MNPALSILVLAAGLMHAGVARAAWTVDVDAGFVRDDNLSRAQLERDIKSDTAMEASVAIGQYFQMTDSTGLSVSGELRGARYARFIDLDHTDLGLTIASRTKFGLGLYAPWLRVAVSASRLDYRSDIRDGWLYAIGVGAGKRVSGRLELSADYRFENRTSNYSAPVVRSMSPAVFDQQNHILSLRADTTLTAATLVSLGYTRKSGDITSSTLRNSAIFGISSAIAPDPAFGASAVAYRLGATTHLLSLGISRELSSHASLNLALDRYASHGEGDINYYGNVVRAAYLHSF